MAVAKQPGEAMSCAVRRASLWILGEAVHRLLQQVRRGVDGAVVFLVGDRVLEAEVAGEVDDAGSLPEHAGHGRGADLVRQAEEDDVHPLRGLLGRELLEAELGAPLQVGVRGGEQVAHVVDGGDADEIDVGVDEQPADDLGGAVAAAAEDGCLEALHAAALPPRRRWITTLGAGILARRATRSWHAPAMIDAIRAYLEGRQAPMLAAIERLVAVNSYTENREGGARVGELLAEELRAIPGVSVRAVPSARFAPHLVASTRAAEASAAGAVAIVGHLDTVFPPGTFEGFRRDGELARGPGVLDMKGGLVVAFEALRALAAAGLLARAAVRFVIVSDEEVGSPEGQDLLRRELAGAACALVLEAGRAADKVITARKGTGSAAVAASGKAAHAGNAHDKGANAIWALARFVDRAQALTDYPRGVTVNVGRVGGGQSKNTVPDRAECAVDFRFERIADGEATFAALRAAAAAAAASVPGTSLAVEGGPARSPLERTEENVALYRAYAACARAAGLGDGEAPLLGGGSDASTTAAMGIPSIDGLGPRGSGFHTRDELIEVASLLPKAEAMAAFLATRLVDTGRG